MTDPVLGIDLGTTNSVVAVDTGDGPRVARDAEGHALVPSIVSFPLTGEIVVGRAARDRRLIDAHNTVYSVKRLIGRPYASDEVRRAVSRFPFELREGPTGGVLVHCRGEDYSLSEISAFVLGQVRGQAERQLGQPCSRAVVTVPANFNELQRSATKAAGRVAGLEVLRILNEPTAAALAYGYGRGSRERIAVFDLGGGTFDITILDLAGEVFEVLATAGDTHLGGDDVDTLIADRMAAAFLKHHSYDPKGDAQAFERLRVAAEWAKCQLSTEKEVHVRVEDLAYAPDGTALDLGFGLGRDALERMAQPLLARAFDVCEDAMRVAQLRPTQLDNVILVGGSTRMPLVKRMVADYFGRQPLSDIDPDLVVAQGAAIQGRALSAMRSGPTVAQAAPQPSPTQDLERAHPPMTEDDEPTVPRGESPLSESTAPGPSKWVASADRLPPPAPAPGSPGQGAPGDGRSTVPDPEPLGARAEPSAPPQPAPPASQRPPSPSVPPDAVEPASPAPPLLLDVTPLSLGVETVSGFCEHIIPRNAAIPVERSRLFSTAKDDQHLVRVQICQGESRRISENQPLGAIELSGIRSAPRGQVKIDVTFVMDADGTLGVRARDMDTGREQTVRINLIGGVPDAQVRTMAVRHRERFRQS